MSIGITQLILLILVAVILFGNLPKVFKDLSTGIGMFRQSLTKQEAQITSQSKEPEKKSDSKS